MTELTPTQQQVLVLLANGRTTDSAAKEVGADRNTVSDWRRSIPEFQRSFAIAQYEQTLYWREQLQQLGTLAIMCIKEAMVEKSGNRNLRAAVVVLDRIIKLAPEQPELAGQRHANSQTSAPNPRPDAETAATPAQSCTTDPSAVAPDPESAGPETPQEPHNPAQSAQPKETGSGKVTESASFEKNPTRKAK